MAVEQFTKSFNLEIVTPDKVVMNKKVVSVIVPAFEGYLGVLANHAPIIAELQAGIIKITEPLEESASYTKKCIVGITGGFFEVKDNSAVVLADTVEYIEEKMVDDFDGLNLAEAKESIQKAQKHTTHLDEQKY